MPALVIKSIPESLHQRLKAAAAVHHRSLTQEAIILLGRALSSAEMGNSTPPYFARRSLLPEFAEIELAGTLAPREGDRDITDLISDDRG